MKGFSLRHIRPRTVCYLSICLLSACAVGPDFHAPKAPSTHRYSYLPLPHKTASTANAGQFGNSQYFQLGMHIPGDWWRVFHSPAINQRVEQGIAHNPTLAAAKYALREAKYNLYAQAGSLLFPSADLQTAALRDKSNSAVYGVNAPVSVFGLNNAQVSTSYMLDIWGQSRRTIEAYAAQADYQRYEMMAAYLSVTSNIITTSVAVASLQDQMDATKQLIKTEKAIFHIAKQQYAVGGTNQQNVLAQQTQLAQTEATLPPLGNALAQAQHNLAALLGRYTSEEKPLQLHLNDLHLPQHIPVSLPSALVQQRPDIQAQEALLHVTSAKIGVATANLLPKITLTASYGWIAQSTTNWLTAPSSIWNMAANLAQPLFHGGQLWFQRKAALMAFKQSAEQYKQVVLQAFTNVSDSLSAIQFDAKQFRADTYAEKSANKTLKITRAQYKTGGENYLAVLNAQKQFQQTRLERIKAQAARLDSTVALYQSLGGGWWNNPISNYEQASQSGRKKS